MNNVSNAKHLTPVNPTNVSNIEGIQRDGHVGQPTNPIAGDAVTSIESLRLRRFGGAFGFVSTGLLFLATMAPATFAAQAVTISGQPIQVQGTVETLEPRVDGAGGGSECLDGRPGLAPARFEAASGGYVQGQP